MLTINPIKDITIDSRQPWLYLYRLSGTHEVITFEINSGVIDVSGYIEIAVRTFKNDVYMGDLVGAYERTYRLGNGAIYAYEMKNTTGLICEIWVRFVSRVFYVQNIDIDITNIEIIETPENTNEDEMISILLMDSNWMFNGAGRTFHSPLVSFNGGETATGALELGWFNPKPTDTKVWIPLMGGLNNNKTLKRIKIISENGSIFSDNDMDDLLGNPLVNDSHNSYRYHLPIPSNKFKLRLEDNDNLGGGWNWLGVYPEGCILSV
jgi:hypothetical protein